MKNIGLITTPLNSGHAVRGVGFYTRNLLLHLHKSAPGFGYQIHELSRPVRGMDLIHYPFFDLFFHTLPMLKTTATVVTIHDLVPLRYPDHYPPGLRGLINYNLQKIALTNVKTVITDSISSLIDIRQYISLPHHRLKLIPLAADDKYRPKKKNPILRKKYRLPAKFVLYVGDVNWNKNLPLLIRACIELCLPLVLVGKQSILIDKSFVKHPETSHLSDILPDLESPSIYRLGFIPDDDLVGLYNLATVYCQPSLAEGFGLPVLEALSCGTPVICSDISPFKDIAADSALYFNPLDQNQLEIQLKKIFSNDSLCDLLSRKGPDQAKSYSWSRTVNQTLLCYRELLTDK